MQVELTDNELMKCESHGLQRKVHILVHVVNQIESSSLCYEWVSARTTKRRNSLLGFVANSSFIRLRI